MYADNGLTIDDEHQLTRHGIKDPTITELRISRVSKIPTLLWFNDVFRNLRVLFVSFCNLNDLSGINGGKNPTTGFDFAGLTHLKELYASYNQIHDLHPLQHHPNLELIDLEGNKVADKANIKHIFTVKTLKSVNLAHNPIAQADPHDELYSPATFLQNLPEITHFEDRHISECIKGHSGSALNIVRANKKHQQKNHQTKQ